MALYGSMSLQVSEPKLPFHPPSLVWLALFAFKHVSSATSMCSACHKSEPILTKVDFSNKFQYRLGQCKLLHPVLRSSRIRTDIRRYFSKDIHSP